MSDILLWLAFAGGVVAYNGIIMLLLWPVYERE